MRNSNPPNEPGRGVTLLDRFGVRIGQRVEILTTDGLVITGLLIPRYEHADSNYIVLKLKSGYNIGLRSSNIKSVKLLDDVTATNRTEVETRSVVPHDRRNLRMLSTGGTIASRIDYRTGAVHPALSAQDLYASIPELDEIASIEPEVVFSVYSENMGPREWQLLSEKIVQKSEKSPDGIVIMVGTDTMAYAAAALSFSTIGIGIPIVLVGAQRSTDRPSSDGALNLKAACRFAVEGRLPGVYIAMHENESDDSIAIHSGTRVRKNHTSRRDAFESIDVPLIARVNEKQILIDSSKTDASINDTFRSRTKFSSDVALVKFHPGFDPSILDYLWNEKRVKGIIIEGTGLGHVSSNTVLKIAELTRAGVFVGIASQCIWGRVDLNVYETGRDLIFSGASHLDNMLAETAFAKLSWALANFEDTKKVMMTNLVGEFTSRIPLG